MDKHSDLEKRHFVLAKRMFQAYGGALYPVDLYAIGSIKRSLSHCKGFATMLATKNLTCAGGIIRMQLDTLLRFFAVFLVDNPHDFATSVTKGKPVKEHKDRSNQKMHDGYLVKQLSKEFPWIENVYKETSGYVHFSKKHIFSTMHNLSEDGKFEISISSDDIEDAEKFHNEAILAFIHITNIFLDYIEGWIITKKNPELATKSKL